MGLCGSSLSEADKKEAAMTRTIDAKNKAAAKEEQSKVKLLLLGAGESGKSTIFKQMKILYGNHHGFTNEERATYAPTIYGNIISNMKTLLENTEHHSPIKNKELKLQMDGFMKKDDGKDASIDAESGAVIKAFWSDPDVQATWKVRASFQVQDALAFYCAEIGRISAKGYVPTPQDILRARVRTSGIVEETYVIDGVTFVMFDVGGQRNERKKWIHCFDEVTAVIFVAAMNEYDQVLYEDATQNRMNEAVILFDEICNSQFFTRTSMILFLNKRYVLCLAPPAAFRSSHCLFNRSFRFGSESQPQRRTSN